MGSKVEFFDMKNLKSLGVKTLQEVPQRGDYVILPGDPAERYQVSSVNYDYRTNQQDFVIYVVPKKLLVEKVT